MTEYEYSFKVKDIKPFIDFCNKENYIKHDKVSQTRILYKNNNKILARITKDEKDGEVSSYIDFKQENELEEVLKVSQESPTLKISDDNEKFINSILSMFNFSKSKELQRIRYVFSKNDVKFEIDEYINPIMKVVAVEGEKDQVDNVYNQIQDLYIKYKI